MTKVYKRYNLLIQLAILVISYFFIINQVFWKQDLPSLLKTLGEDLGSSRFVTAVLVCILLMAVNWMLEAVKWKLLIGKVEEVSFIRSLEAVLTGVTVSSFTPNRVGEFFGRAFILRKASHFEGILITILGSMSQLMVTILTGTVAILIFVPLFLTGSGAIPAYLYLGLVTLVLSIDLLILGLYFNVSFLSAMKEKILTNGLSRIRRYFRVFTFYSNRELWQVLGLSFARYTVFSTQYVILLWTLDIQVPLPVAYMLISLIYFIMAAIPTVALTELGIRGSVAIYFFSFYFSSGGWPNPSLNLGVLMASVLLWFINLGIPAVLGSFFLFRLQFFRNSDNR
jgi:hypothetical protein